MENRSIIFFDKYIPTVGIKEEKMKVDVKKVTKGYGNLPILQDCLLSFKREKFMHWWESMAQERVL